MGLPQLMRSTPGILMLVLYSLMLPVLMTV